MANAEANVLLVGESRDHLVNINVAWAKKYLYSLTDVTAIIVSTPVYLTTAAPVSRGQTPLSYENNKVEEVKETSA